MNLTWIGLTAAAATFGGVWLGHVAVRKIEYLSLTVWLPSSAALVAGLLLEAASLASDNPNFSAAAGILGMTLLWDALEFWRQQKRVRKGHAPANPRNPRHARILHDFPQATTIDWLDRYPTGRRLNAEEIRQKQEGGE